MPEAFLRFAMRHRAVIYGRGSTWVARRVALDRLVPKMRIYVTQALVRSDGVQEEGGRVHAATYIGKVGALHVYSIGPCIMGNGRAIVVRLAPPPGGEIVVRITEHAH